VVDPAPDDDFALLDAWRSGDEDAGSELLRRQFDALYRFFRSKVPDDAVGELIQQTLFTCVEKREQFRGDARFSTYVFSIARRAAIAYYRGRQRDAAIDPGATSIEDLARSPSGVLMEREQDRLLLKGLRSIPIDHQILLELHYWERLPGPALAEVLEVPEGTVRTRLRRAKTLLREAIERIAADPEVAKSTVDDLAAWAEALRDRLGR
jgi:RNA polymerase sigma factor (sigma-70 family)